jgi:hypothetical protein
MTNLQAFMLGVMVILTPSLVALAVFFWHAPTLGDEFTPAREET